MKSRKNAKKICYKIFQWVITLIVAFIILLPLYWIFISSITPANELFSTPVDYFPDHPTLENYFRLFFQLNIGPKAINTLIIIAISLFISTLVCTTGGYAFARYHSRGLNISFSILLASSLIPGIVTARPLYDFFKTLNLIDTYPGLIILYTSSLLPFTVMIIRNFVGALPVSIEEAAEVDGANFWKKFFFVILPLLRPAIATVCIINFILCLNDLLIPLFYSLHIEVLSVAITTIPRESTYSMPWDMISTTGWFIVFPIILFVLIFEKNIMEGIMAGGVKQ